MTHQQYLSGLALDAAGQLRRAGCQVLAVTAINARPWLKAKMPERITADRRRHILAIAWKAPAAIEWRVQ